jgi:cobalamin biosynthetic protein CobC
MRRFPDAPAPLLDLSTGINPLAYPVPELAPELWARLPDPEAVARLEAAAAQACGIADPARVVAAPGTQAIIGVLPHLLPPGAVGILSPTYAEHRRSWEGAGRRVTAVASPDALPNAAIGVLCNPNNPDGRRLAPADLLALADRMAARGGVLVVDEAFADPEARIEPHPVVVRLRSFGKFHGLAGLRLGFAILPLPFAPRLRQVLGPWPVSGPAIAIGTAALRDAAWTRATRLRLDGDAVRLDLLLRRAGLRAAGCGGTPLFRLVHEPPGLWQRLGERGILARRFEQGWLRFGLPGTEAEWTRLESALSASDARPARTASLPDPATPQRSAPPLARPDPAACGSDASDLAIPHPAVVTPSVLHESPGFDAAFRDRLDALFRWRRDVRRFRRDDVAPGTLDRLIATACLAPSVGLCQPWRFAVVADPLRRARIRDIFRASNAQALACYDGERAGRYARLKLSGLEDAPVQFAVLADRATPDGHGLGRATMPEMAEYSVVTAVHTLWLAARAEGLGLGWVSILDPAAVAAALDLPAAWRLVGYFCLGHPEREDERPELERLAWERRRPWSEFVLHR